MSLQYIRKQTCKIINLPIFVSMCGKTGLDYVLNVFMYTVVSIREQAWKRFSNLFIYPIVLKNYK